MFNKFLSTLFLGAFLSAGALIANEGEVEASHDVSRNPLTGTVTEKDKTSKKVQRSDGSTAETATTDVKKTKKDGTVTRKIETERKDEPAE